MPARLQRESLAATVLGLGVWSVHFVVVYGLFSVGCAAGWGAPSLLGLDRLALVLVLVSLPFLLFLLWLAWGSLVHWRRARAGQAGLDDPPARGRFLAMTAFWLNLLVLTAALWVSLALILTTPC